MRKFFVLFLAFSVVFLIGCKLSIDDPAVTPAEPTLAPGETPTEVPEPTPTLAPGQTPVETPVDTGASAVTTKPSSGSSSGSSGSTAKPTQKPSSGSTAKPTQKPSSDSTAKPTQKPVVTPDNSTPKPTYPVIVVPGLLASELTLENEVVWPFFDLNMDPTTIDKEDVFPLVTQVFGTLSKLKFTEQGLSENRVLPIRLSPVASALENKTYNIGVDNTYYDLCVALAEVVGADNVFFFGYDWRMDLTLTGKALESYVDLVCERTGSDRVNIVAHSMGGNVTASYLMQASNVKVSTVVTLGSPFEGSDMATELLYEKEFSSIVRTHVLPILGYGKQTRSDGSSMQDMMINAATNAMYDVAVTLPSIFSMVPEESQGLFTDNNSVAARTGFESTRTIAAAYAKSFAKVEHYNIIGVGSDVIKFEYSGSSYEKVMVNGDGTVSKDSACAGGIFTNNTTELELGHVELATDAGAIDLIVDYLY